jgi:opacity protein-like surface antigen
MFHNIGLVNTRRRTVKKELYLAAVVALGIVVGANAQMVALQSMEDFSNFSGGKKDVIGSLNMSSDVKFIGARYNYNLGDSFRAFGEFGYSMVDDDSLDESAFTVGAGGIFRFSNTTLNLPENLDCGLRGMFFVPFFEDITAYGGQLGLHGAYPVNGNDQIKIFGGIGMYYFEYEYDIENPWAEKTHYYISEIEKYGVMPAVSHDDVIEEITVDDNESGIYATAGASYKINQQLKLIGEVTYVDTKDADQDITFGVGAGIGF